MNAIDTAYSNHVDVYLSFGIGIAFAIAVIGFFHVFRSFRKSQAARAADLSPIENQK